MSNRLPRKTEGFPAFWRRPCRLRAEDGVTAAGKSAGRGPENTSIRTASMQRKSPFSLLDLAMQHMGGKDKLRELSLNRSDVDMILSGGHNHEGTTMRFSGLAGFV